MIGLRSEDLALVLVRIWQNKLIILLITLAGAMAGLALAEIVEDSLNYQATSSVCVSYTTQQEQLTGGSVLNNYTEVVTSDRVCENAAAMIADTGVRPADIRSSIGISLTSSSYVMKISAKNRNPETAQKIANAVADAYVAQVTLITGSSAIQLLDTARDATPISGNESKNLLILCIIVSFIASVLWIVLRTLASGKVCTISQCVDDMSEILTIIPSEEKRGKHAKNMLRGVVRRPPG